MALLRLDKITSSKIFPSRLSKVLGQNKNTALCLRRKVTGILRNSDRFIFHGFTYLSNHSPTHYFDHFDANPLQVDIYAADSQKDPRVHTQSDPNNHLHLSNDFLLLLVRDCSEQLLGKKLKSL